VLVVVGPVVLVVVVGMLVVEVVVGDGPGPGFIPPDPKQHG
jgi:hypothetical protein